MTTETRTAADLISDLEKARSEVRIAIEGLPESEMTRPVDGTWSVKDMLAHISSWDELGATDITRASRGHVPALMAFKDDEIDDWNAGLMRGRTMFSLPQALFELDDRRQRLVEVLNSAPEQLINGPLAARLVDVLVEHDQMHAREISEWRQGAGV
jgi:hypothetical protein